jgi:hypothetical protein
VWSIINTSEITIWKLAVPVKTEPVKMLLYALRFEYTSVIVGR